jgi:hypothetical protein
MLLFQNFSFSVAQRLNTLFDKKKQKKKNEPYILNLIIKHIGQNNHICQMTYIYVIWHIYITLPDQKSKGKTCQWHIYMSFDIYI